MNRLKFLRIEKGETLEKLADFLNVTIQTISNYENEKRDMTPDTIVKLADYFNVSTDFLLGKSDIRNPEEIKFANASGIDTEGLSKEEIQEIQRQVEFIRWKKKDKYTNDEN